MRRPEWDDGPAEALVAVYFVAQMLLPLCLVAWSGVRYSKVLEHSLAEGKRKAVLQRRGVFDFVSLSSVFLAGALETHTDRVRAIGLGVKACIYSCIACVVFVSLDFTLVLLDLQRSEPFALSVFFVTCALLCFMGFTAPPEALGLGGRPLS
jgi:hypothetical protein